MNLLIVVQASQSGLYPEIMQAQKDTWDSIPHPNVRTVYYQGDPTLKRPTLVDRTLTVPVSDEYDMMAWKFKRCLDHIWQWKWDYIFRTNASTYVRKERIYNYIKENSMDYGGFSTGNMVSGTGIIMSRKAAKIVRDNIRESPNDSEDTLIGSILVDNGIQPAQALNRLHYNFAEHKILDADYWRCKSEVKDESGNLDRRYDIIAFNELFKYLKSK